MATFHSTDRWFILGIAIIVLHFLLLSGWYSLRHVLYSQIWTLASIARIIFAILFIILHSKLSSPALLLATVLWNLICLAILLVAHIRTYIHVSNVLEAGQKSALAFLKAIQYLSCVAVLFFATATGCWVRAATTTKKRAVIKKAARALNWAGGSVLILCFIVGIATGLIVVFWSRKKRQKAPAPALLVTYGALVSTPFMIARLIIQMVWMRHRNSIGTNFGAYIGGGVAMDFMTSFVNLLVAWYTLSMVQNDIFIRTHDLQERKKRMMLRGIKFREEETTDRNTRRASLVRSAISLASVSTIASITRTTSIVTDHRTDRPLPSKFTVKTTGRGYRMDDGNTLIRSVRHAYKEFHTSSDSVFDRQPYQLNAALVRATAQRVLEQIAKLLWLFTLWESLENKDADQRRALETDITSVWYEDLPEVTGLETPPIRNMRTFTDISGAVLGTKEKRPVDKMLERVFLHFFDRLRDHDAETRASLCLFALRFMLKQDLTEGQDFQPSFADDKEAEILDIGADIRQKFDNLAARISRPAQSGSSLQ